MEPCPMHKRHRLLSTLFSVNWSRLLSLVVAGAYLLILFRTADPKVFFALLAYLALPLACIWFPEEISEFSIGGRMTQRTPGCGVVLGGWILLLLPVVLYLVLRHEPGVFR
jgi:hypothetical protein